MIFSFCWHFLCMFAIFSVEQSKLIIFLQRWIDFSQKLFSISTVNGSLMNWIAIQHKYNYYMIWDKWINSSSTVIKKLLTILDLYRDVRQPLSRAWRRIDTMTSQCILNHIPVSLFLFFHSQLQNCCTFIEFKFHNNAIRLVHDVENSFVLTIFPPICVCP